MTTLEGLTICVTGGTGFVGSALAAALAVTNQVVAVQRHPAPLPAGVEPIWDDLAAPHRHRYPAKIDAVFHLAAMLDNPVAGGKEPANRALFRANVQATINCLDLAERLGATRFIYGSSGGVYGLHVHPIAEHHDQHPLNFYGQSKRLAEQIVSWYAPRFQTCVTLRYFFPYGPGNSNAFWRMVLRCLRDGQPVPLPSDGRPRFNPIFIDDAVGLSLAAAILQGTHCLNVAGAKAIDRRALTARLAAGLGCQWREQPLPPTGSDCIADMGAALAATGYRYTVSLEEGLTRTVAAARDIGAARGQK
jgi:UDP-glucose 4-epimerase